MSLNGNNILAGASGQTTGYDIDQSLRFNNADTPYLSWTPSSTATSTKICTISCWIKRGQINQERRIFTATQAGSTPRTEFTFNTNDYLVIGLNPTGGGWYQANTTALYRDPSAWYHIVWALDTSQATASNRSALYVNGEQVTDFSSNTLNDSTAVPQDSAILMGQSGMLQVVGAYANILGQSAYDGYMAEFHFVDGQKLTPASFGETNEDTNQWQAIEYEGSYGTNGFYLKFQDSSALGDDSSGNTNDFTPTNLAATDQVLDSPTNNFATLNPTVGNAGTTIEGNLVFDPTTAWHSTAGTFGATSGKWYFEYYVFDKTNNGPLGVRDDAGLWDETGGPPGYAEYGPEGSLYRDGLTTITGVGTLSAGDIVGVAVNMDDGEIQWFKNGAVLSGSGNVAVSLPTTTQSGFLPYLRAYGPDKYGANFGQDSSFAGAVTAQGNTDGNGKGDFYYTPPSGYLALCSDNLSDPSIADPTAYFNTVAYSGNGSTQSITTGLQPDFTWIKGRSYASNHRLIDSVRGAGERLSSNLTDAETTESNGLTSFNSDGFSVGTEGGYNNSGQTFVSWNWKAGGTASSNTDGSITSSVSANTDAGFSIVSYTGNGTNGATVGHGLGVTPDAIILKNRDSTAYNDNWMVRHIGVGDVASGTAANLKLNSADAPTDSPSRGWPEITNSSVLTLVSGGSGITNCNETGDNYIAYCFHSVDGYSKVGSYESNNVSDGPFIYTGFSPAFMLFKNIDGTEAWSMFDTARNTINGPDAKLLMPSASSAESSTANRDIDFLSNGFKIRASALNPNTGTNTYIFLAMASSPFKYSNAR